MVAQLNTSEAVKNAPVAPATSELSTPQKGIALNPNLFKREEYVSTTYQALIPSEHNFERLLDPGYWAHCARLIRSGTEIKARNDKFYAWLLVVSNGETWAKVVVLHYVQLSQAQIAEPPRAHFKIDKSGDGWRVIHRDTGRPIVSGLANRDQAEEYLTEHLRVLASR